jgi:hypothetical protein
MFSLQIRSEDLKEKKTARTLDPLDKIDVIFLSLLLFLWNLWMSKGRLASRHLVAWGLEFKLQPTHPILYQRRDERESNRVLSNSTLRASLTRNNIFMSYNLI